MSTHTPGPWDISGPAQACGQGFSEPYCSINLYAASGIIAYLLRDLEGNPTDALNVSELQANARLIAAAPELLEALQQATQLLKAVNIAESDWVLFRAQKDFMEQAQAVIRKARGESPAKEGAA